MSNLLYSCRVEINSTRKSIVVSIDAATLILVSTMGCVRRFVTLKASGLTVPVMKFLLVSGVRSIKIRRGYYIFGKWSKCGFLPLSSVALSLLSQSSCHHNLKTLWYVRVTLWCFFYFYSIYFADETNINSTFKCLINIKKMAYSLKNVQTWKHGLNRM